MMFATPTGRKQAFEKGMGGVGRPYTDQTSTEMEDQTTAQQVEGERAALQQGGQGRSQGEQPQPTGQQSPIPDWQALLGQLPQQPPREAQGAPTGIWQSPVGHTGDTAAVMPQLMLKIMQLEKEQLQAKLQMLGLNRAHADLKTRYGALEQEMLQERQRAEGRHADLQRENQTLGQELLQERQEVEKGRERFAKEIRDLQQENQRLRDEVRGSVAAQEQMRASINQLTGQTADNAQTIGRVEKLSLESINGVQEAVQTIKEVVIPVATSTPQRKEEALQDLSTDDDSGLWSHEATAGSSTTETSSESANGAGRQAAPQAVKNVRFEEPAGHSSDSSGASGPHSPTGQPQREQATDRLVGVKRNKPVPGVPRFAGKDDQTLSTFFLKRSTLPSVSTQSCTVFSLVR